MAITSYHVAKWKICVWFSNCSLQSKHYQVYEGAIYQAEVIGQNIYTCLESHVPLIIKIKMEIKQEKFWITDLEVKLVDSLVEPYVDPNIDPASSLVGMTTLAQLLNCKFIYLVHKLFI